MLTNTAEHFFNAHAGADEAGRKIIAYRIEPVREPAPGALMSSAEMRCFATLDLLSASGGGDLYLAPGLVEALVCDGRVVAEAIEQTKKLMLGGIDG